MTTDHFRDDLESLMHEAVDDGLAYHEIMGVILSLLAQDCLNRVDPEGAATALGTIILNAVTLGRALHGVGSMRVH